MAAQLAASKVLSEAEALILVNETRTPRLRYLNNDEYHDKFIDIISEIKIITGALVYPDGSQEQHVQVEVLKRFVRQSPRFQMLTAGEITHAFYLNAEGIYPETYRHYNRELNAEFMGDVLRAYCKYKDRFLARSIGDINRMLNPPPEMIIPEITTDDWKGYVNDDLERMRTGNRMMIFNTTPKYILLRRLGYIRIRSRKAWWLWYRHAVELRRRQLLMEAAETDGGRARKKQTLAIYDAILQTGAVPLDEHQSFVHYMRRVIYLDTLEALAGCGITDLFTDVKPFQ